MCFLSLSLRLVVVHVGSVRAGGPEQGSVVAVVMEGQLLYWLFGAWWLENIPLGS